MCSKKVLATAVMVTAAFLSLNGCNKKQQSLEEMQAPMSADSLGSPTLDNKSVLQDNQVSAQPLKAGEKSLETSAVAVQQGASGVLEPLPPAGPYKPTGQDIQTALKNAGYYSGKIDGKVGPKTKAAIEEFQKANGLKADGKVGPKTWAALEQHLNVSSVNTITTEQPAAIQ